MDSIIWRQGDDIFLEDNSGQQHLVLYININHSDNNTVYTCEVNILLPAGKTVIAIKTFILNIGGKYRASVLIM